MMQSPGSRGRLICLEKFGDEGEGRGKMVGSISDGWVHRVSLTVSRLPIVAADRKHQQGESHLMTKH